MKNNFKSTLKSNFSSVSKNYTIKTDLHKLFKSKVIFNLSNLIDIYSVKELKWLNCHNCPLLNTIPNIEGVVHYGNSFR